ncbi:response regulator transcription factor [Desulfoscipio gibsoniae]|uniref:Stage 0 sporulation protein A homolog n=1 Tax=Desulfoscipio gibsoniae DSM 7213 TaxID=767817 RepID=R4KIF2_9FIRM|nr:response regulator transcription factor [Desulfoscipio gibsoniae]AGL01407.1 response regulator containing a CheY-like receiver domain and an HTH DNA-binding domain [Desulfoscipio gibsoniae DSM 7213]
MSLINLMIVDDHLMIREGLTTMLGDCEDISIVGTCGDGDEANLMARKIQPDIVLMDIKMGATNGIEAARKIINEHPEIKIIFLTVFEDSEFMRQALQAGAAGYILKHISKEKLIDSIRRVHLGEKIIDPTVFNTIVTDYIKLTKTPNIPEKTMVQTVQFTPREKEILFHLTKGMTNKEISVVTHLSVDTIKTHLRNIFRKLNVKNRSQAINHGIKYFNSLSFN